jgi:cation diffusion facilitator CzcD-associated flavoprotein CzcO
MRRVPLETDYYEAYNQENVELVDVLSTPIERITPKGVVVGEREYELDVLIYATGFDAFTGALDRIEIRGLGGRCLSDKWADELRTYLGFASSGFPNLLTLVGPHNGSTFCNMPRCIEQNVEWAADLVRYVKENGYRRVDATEEAETTWTQHVHDLAAGSLLTKAPSWFTGVNVNLPDRKPRILQYMGGAPLFRQKCDEVAQKGYEGFSLS